MFSEKAFQLLTIFCIYSAHGAFGNDLYVEQWYVAVILHYNNSYIVHSMSFDTETRMPYLSVCVNECTLHPVLSGFVLQTSHRTALINNMCL